MVKHILKLEGLAILLISLYFYQHVSGDWILFVILIFTPDVSMIGYLKDKKLGSLTYNLVHNYILAIIIILWGVLSNNAFFTSVGLILAAHIGLDRFLGFGLKYPKDFRDTHFGKL